MPAAIATSEGYLIFSFRPRLGLAVTLVKLKIGAPIYPEESASWPSGRVLSLGIFCGQCPACLVRKRNSQVPSARPPDLRSQIPDIPIPGRPSHCLPFLPPLTVMAEVPLPQVSFTSCSTLTGRNRIFNPIFMVEEETDAEKFSNLTYITQL